MFLNTEHLYKVIVVKKHLLDHDPTIEDFGDLAALPQTQLY